MLAILMRKDWTLPSLFLWESLLQRHKSLRFVGIWKREAPFSLLSLQSQREIPPRVSLGIERQQKAYLVRMDLLPSASSSYSLSGDECVPGTLRGLSE